MLSFLLFEMGNSMIFCVKFFRKLADQSNTFLAFDVIAELNCDQDIKRYLQTFYGDVLICKTDDIAQELAYPDNNFKNWRDVKNF